MRGKKFARKSIGSQHPVAPFDIDADARSGGQAEGDTDHRAATRMGNIEIKRTVRPVRGELRAPARAAAYRDGSRLDAKRSPQHEPERRSAGHVLPAQRLGAEACRARMLGRR